MNLQVPRRREGLPGRWQGLSRVPQGLVEREGMEDDGPGPTLQGRGDLPGQQGGGRPGQDHLDRLAVQ